MYRNMPLVSAVALALMPLALQAVTLDASSGPVVSASPQRTQADAMAEALARVGLYRYSTRYQTVVKPSAPIYVAAPVPAPVAPSAPPPPPAADCDSSAPPPAPAVEQPVAPVVFVPPPAPLDPVAPVAPAATSLFPVEPEAPAMPSSQARLQEFFIQVLGARSRLKVVNVTAAPVVITAPAPVLAAPVVVAQAAPKPACTPKGDSGPPAAAPGDAGPTGSEQLADLGIESLRQGEPGVQGQPGESDSFGDDPSDWLIDAVDPPREGSEGPNAFSVEGPVEFGLEFEGEPAVGSVPEPGSLALLGLGLIGLGMSRRRAAAR